jgi:hypothetical protein
MDMDLNNVIFMFDREVGGNIVRSLMADLAADASLQGFMQGDRRASARRAGRIHTDPMWKPGAFIERLSPEKRAVLRELRSYDIQDLAPMHTDMLEVCWTHRETDPRQRVEGPFADGKSRRLPSTTFKIGGTDPDRNP